MKLHLHAAVLTFRAPQQPKGRGGAPVRTTVTTGRFDPTIPFGTIGRSCNLGRLGIFSTIVISLALLFNDAIEICSIVVIV